MTDDRLDEKIMAEARKYHEPPATPREEIWARIQAARQAGVAPKPEPEVEVIHLPTWRSKRTLGLLVALAATLFLGISIGRWSGVTSPEMQGIEGTGTTTASTSADRAETVVRFAAVEHLGRVDALLTDYQTGRTTEGFRTNARDLLSRTRLLLDSEQLSDPNLRKLLEDLEVLLMQVAQLPRTGPGEERALIDDNLAERAIRPRLRNALPSGPAA